MKLAYLPLNFVMPLQMKKINSIVVETPHIYDSMIMDLYRQMNREEEQWNLLQDEEFFAMDKYCDLLMSPADLHFHKKEIQKELIPEIIREIESSEKFEALLEQHGDFVQLMSQICDQYKYLLEYDFDFSLKEYLKHYKVTLADLEGSALEKLLEYIPVVQELTGKTVFFLHGYGDYLSENDFKHLQKWAKYQEYYIVFLGSRQLLLKENTNEYIIDSDLCEIH